MMQQRAVTLNVPKVEAVDIEFSNLLYEVQMGFRGPKKQILQGVSGKFKSGELTAIMGPSGAGKSSLLNILTGFSNNNLQDNIAYITKRGKQSRQMFRKECSYIQQDDQLHPFFTVTEMMMMAADLKLGISLNRKAKGILIDDILDTLDLIKAKGTRCNRLSGGQKKRLSIALELVDNPPVMFLDEPTTGLDSSSSLQCVAMLHNIARSGRTIICTIHQPSAAIYEMIDHVYLMAEGRCMYQGSASNTVPYFSSLGLRCPKYHNPADYMIEVVSKEYGDFNDHLERTAKGDQHSWRTKILTKSQVFEQVGRQSSAEGKATVLITPPSEYARFFILLNRCVTQYYRDWTAVHLKVIVHFFVAFVLGLLYSNVGGDGNMMINNFGYLLVTVVYICYTSLMPSVLKFPLELAILKKERFNNWYQLKTYYAATLVVNIPVQILFAVVYSSVSYFMSSQPLEAARFLMFLGITILTTFVAESIGVILGTTMGPVNGTFLGAIVTCAMLSFTGFLALFNHMPKFLYYISYLSYLRYAMDGLVQSLYGYNREKLDCSSIYCHYRIPSVLLDEFAMLNGKYWLDAAILFVNFVLLRLLGYCVLKRKLSSI